MGVALAFLAVSVIIYDGDVPEPWHVANKIRKEHKIRIKIKKHNSESVIKIEGLSKFFRTEEVETIALNNVSLEVKDGEFVAIMGPSGCGKSTLLNILGLLDNPTSGDYYLAGKEVGHLKEKERTQVRKGNIGFVFQSFNLIDELNVFENVELPLTYLKVKAGERKQMVNDILKRMNISHRAGHFPQQLSGGQQQRVAIARAVVSNPKIIPADEPTGNLGLEERSRSDAIAHRTEPGRDHDRHGDSLQARCQFRPPDHQSVRRKHRLVGERVYLRCRRKNRKPFDFFPNGFFV